MRKAVLKRIKITKTGKMLRRRSRINHFNAKEPRRVQMRQKRAIMLTGTLKKKMRRYMQ